MFFVFYYVIKIYLSISYFVDTYLESKKLEWAFQLCIYSWIGIHVISTTGYKSERQNEKVINGPIGNSETNFLDWEKLLSTKMGN